MTKSDQRGIIVIISLLAIVCAMFGLFSIFGMEYSNPVDDATGKNEVSSNGRFTKQNHTTTEETYNIPTEKKELFYFDPNTADSTQLLKLGLKPWQVRNIYRYRAKGGIYRSKEDFAYLYGLTVKEYRRLSPYIRISSDYLPASTLPEVRERRNRQEKINTNNADGSSTTASDKPRQAYTPKIHKGEYISVNTADTTELMKIPGIGSYYARQIVRHRDRLGGFFSKEQLLEIENFPEEAMAYINVDYANVHKLNVNRLTLAQLRKHPYINYYQAKAIVDYRRLHGEISDIKELRLLKEFSASDFKRIEPYIEY